MRIKSIQIENYRQYKNLFYTFDKPFTNEHDLHVIVAQNGVGKSNFLNAITWCLYDEESHLQDKYKALPIVNLDTINSTEDKELITVKVEITIEINNELETISRETAFIRTDKLTQKVLKQSTTLRHSYNAFDPIWGYKKLTTLTGEQAKISINKIFPKGINEYFFFDNEQMNNYFTSNQSGTIQRAINLITKVDLIQTAISRLSLQQKEYKKGIGQNDNNITKLSAEIDSKHESIAKLTNDIKKLEADIEKAEKELKVISEQVKGAENLKHLEKRRDDLSKLRDTYKDECFEIDRQIDEFIVKYTTLINLYPSFTKTLNLINELDKDRQLPPEISLELLRKSIDGEFCEVCENKLDKNHLKIVLEKLEQYTLTSPALELLLSIRSKIRELIRDTKQFDNRKNALLRKQMEKQKALSDTEKELYDLQNEMKTITDKEELIKKLDEREQLESSLKVLNRNYGSKKQMLKELKLLCENLEKKYYSAISLQEKNSKNAERYKATVKLISYMKQVEEELISEIREEISAETYNNFINFIWKENTYSKIEIDENYNVDLIHRRGYSAIGSTSAAERSLLALSFTNAIHKVSGFESPLVIDSPVGRVSDENRRKFAESLAEVSKNKQIIMLFTPDEYSVDISNIFDPIAVKSYASMNETEEITTIGEK